MTKAKTKYPVQITVPLRGDVHLHEALHEYARAQDQGAAVIVRKILRKHLMAAGFYDPDKVEALANP